MAQEQIDFQQFQALDDTQYIYNTGGFVRAADRDNEFYIWQNESGFVTTTDTFSTSGVRDFDPGHIVIEPGVDIDLGVDDFTMEAWIWLDDEPWQWNTIMSQRLTIDTEQSFDFQYFDQKIRLRFNNNETVHDFPLSAASNTDSTSVTGHDYPRSVHENYPTMVVSPSAWHHVAVVRNNGTINVFLDGAKTDDLEVTDTVDIQYSDEPILIGAAADGDNVVKDPLIGYMQDIRLTQQALYVDDFEPGVLTSQQGGQLLGDPHVTTFGGMRYTL